MTVVPLRPSKGPAQAMDSTTVESEELLALREKYEGLDTRSFLEAMIRDEFRNEIAVVSSFGAESAVLLHMIADVDPTVPVLFLNTGKLFGETLRFRDRLQDKLGLTDLRAVGPHPDDLKARDPNGVLWNMDPDSCCFVRKVAPLERALRGFRASITGRKRFQTSARSQMHMIEEEQVRTLPGETTRRGSRYKLNPLATWSLEDLERYMEEHKLPRHPLVKDGYLSIGCMPCTERVPEGGSYRDGRWAGRDKDECGIHLKLPVNEDGDGI